MSLTAFVAQPSVSARLQSFFPTPTIPEKPPLRAAPLTRNHGLVGTAFDYLLRFHLQRLFPESRAFEWVAEEVPLEEAGIGDRVIFIPEILETAKHHHQQYLRSGLVTDGLLSSTLDLARLDAFVRRPELVWEDSPFLSFGRPDPLDIKDLGQLMAVVNPGTFGAPTVCLLNPRFGEASQLVGGADCDLVLDDTLVEIKTVKDFGVTREHTNQLVGYLLLSKIGQLAGAPPGHSVNKIGVYFSRFAHLWTFDLAAATTDAAMAELTTWFRTKAQEQQRSASLA